MKIKISFKSMPIGQILHLENSFPLHNLAHSALKSFQIFDFQTNNPLPFFLVFIQFQLTNRALCRQGIVDCPARN